MAVYRDTITPAEVSALDTFGREDHKGNMTPRHKKDAIKGAFMYPASDVHSVLDELNIQIISRMKTPTERTVKWETIIGYLGWMI